MANNLVKLCHVCGDRAIAFNFNGLTCESCKSFFRRNAFKLTKFKCNRNNECSIEVFNRKYCQRCRLRKCFDIGMKKELVLDRKRKHEQQREELHFKSRSDSLVSSGKLRLIELLREREECDAEKEIEEGEGDIQQIAIPFANADLHLSPYERTLVEEIDLASSVFTEELSLQVSREAKSFKESCNLPALYIKKIIRFCKNIPHFKMLHKDDQLLIVKPFFTEILLIRFAFAYNYEHDAISVIENEIEQNAIWVKIDLLKEANRHSFALVYRKYMFSSKMEMESDITIRNLLATILMFRSRANISCPEFIRYYNVLYKRLLGRYLEDKYQDKEKSAEKYEKLMAVLEKACEITQYYSELYTLLDIKEVTGVLKEIYSLK